MWHAVGQSDSLQRTGIVKGISGQETMQAESVLQKARLASGQKSKGAAFGRCFFFRQLLLAIQTQPGKESRTAGRKEIPASDIWNSFQKMFCQWQRYRKQEMPDPHRRQR